MRIIAGRFKGRSLRGPTDPGVRPTSDRLRETLFNILDVDARCRVLDGFAGTGALGLEALSRGASHATFVDRDPRALAVLERNVDACGAREACVIIRGDFLGFAGRSGHGGRFDLALLDPPYDFIALDAVLAEAASVLAPDGVVVLEHSKRTDPPVAAAGLVRRRAVTAGDSTLSFYAFVPAPISASET